MTYEELQRHVKSANPMTLMKVLEPVALYYDEILAMLDNPNYDHAFLKCITELVVLQGRMTMIRDYQRDQDERLKDLAIDLLTPNNKQLLIDTITSLDADRIIQHNQLLGQWTTMKRNLELWIKADLTEDGKIQPMVYVKLAGDQTES